MSSEAAIQETAARLMAAGESQPRAARDPVNLPMIRNWLEALGGGTGDPDPDTAPPAMIQVWTMPGQYGVRADDDPLGQMNQVLDQAGYTSVVATNCDQAYQRYLKVGEQLSVRTRLLDVTGPKRTALGEGWFVTTRSTWFSADEPVATMDFRILKFRRPEAVSAAATSVAPDPGPAMRPLVTPDTAFFWAGTLAGELRIQRCASCGALRHPPGPMCPACGTPGDGGYVVAAGTGEVFSYVVHHHPAVPGKKLPLVVALVQLPEGVRITGELLGAAPGQVRIGMPVRAEFVRVDDDLTLPAWRTLPPPGDGPPVTPRERARVPLPPQVIDVTPTFVVATALATRDFQDVHHDRDRAVAGGAPDIFLNILTTTGLVQRYVAAWAGPDAVFLATSVRLGVPCHPGDTLTFTGEVSADDGTERVISVVGRCGPGDQVRGDHVTATVRLAPGDDH
jgi:uncharacterized protein